MANDEAELDYPYIAQNALRGVVRDVLSITETMGHLPGEHSFYIEFLTSAPGVQIGDHLKEQYPDRMTIVLQHQFESLTVGDGHFEVTLYFSGVPNHLSIPYDAISQFADPSVNFSLEFPTDAIEANIEENSVIPEQAASEDEDLTVKKFTSQTKEEHTDDSSVIPDDTPPAVVSADVVSLDRFRKK